jgi:ribosomal protein L34
MIRVLVLCVCSSVVVGWGGGEGSNVISARNEAISLMPDKDNISREETHGFLTRKRSHSVLPRREENRGQEASLGLLSDGKSSLMLRHFDMPWSKLIQMIF